jgi:hypothetical protein
LRRSTVQSSAGQRKENNIAGVSNGRGSATAAATKRREETDQNNDAAENSPKQKVRDVNQQNGKRTNVLTGTEKHTEPQQMFEHDCKRERCEGRGGGVILVKRREGPHSHWDQTRGRDWSAAQWSVGQRLYRPTAGRPLAVESDRQRQRRRQRQARQRASGLTRAPPAPDPESQMVRRPPQAQSRAARRPQRSRPLSAWPGSAERADRTTDAAAAAAAKCPAAKCPAASLSSL